MFFIEFAEIMFFSLVLVALVASYPVFVNRVGYWAIAGIFNSLLPFVSI